MKTEPVVKRIQQHDAFLTCQGRVLYSVITGVHEQVEFIGKLCRYILGVFGQQGSEQAFTHIEHTSGRVLIGIGANSYVTCGTYHECDVEVGVTAFGGAVKPKQGLGEETEQGGVVLFGLERVCEELRQKERNGAFQRIPRYISVRGAVLYLLYMLKGLRGNILGLELQLGERLKQRVAAGVLSGLGHEPYERNHTVLACKNMRYARAVVMPYGTDQYASFNLPHIFSVW